MIILGFIKIKVNKFILLKDSVIVSNIFVKNNKILSKNGIINDNNDILEDEIRRKLGAIGYEL